MGDSPLVKDKYSPRSGNSPRGGGKKKKRNRKGKDKSGEKAIINL